MRCGLLFVGAMLLASVLLTVTILVRSSSADAGDVSLAAATVDAPTDLERLKAQWQPDGPRVGDLPFGLSRGVSTPASEPPDAPGPTVVPVVEPATAVATTPAPPRPVTVPAGELYERIAAAFPEDPERAYAVVMCESSGNAATNTGNGYYGLWQFDLGTWQSVGGSGLPSDATVEEQIQRARLLYERRGWSPWGCA